LLASSSSLVDILSGESSNEELRINGHGAVKVNDSDMSNLVWALATNQSLKVLRVYCNTISDANWTLLWQSLAIHSTLKILRLVDIFGPPLPYESLAFQLGNPNSRHNKSLTQCTKAVVEMLRVITVLEDRHLLQRLRYVNFAERDSSISGVPKASSHLVRLSGSGTPPSPRA
jgi:hypothetical protein